MITKTDFENALSEKATAEFTKISTLISRNLDSGIKITEFRVNDYKTPWYALQNRVESFVRSYGWNMQVTDFTKKEGEQRDPYDVSYKRVVLS